MGRGMITRPIWKCPCIKLFITYFRHLEKRHPYWPETKSRPTGPIWAPIWASIWKWSCSNPITGYFPGVWKYFRSYWSYKNAFIWTKYVIMINIVVYIQSCVYYEHTLVQCNCIFALFRPLKVSIIFLHFDLSMLLPFHILRYPRLLSCKLCFFNIQSTFLWVPNVLSVFIV